MLSNLLIISVSDKGYFRNPLNYIFICLFLGNMMLN